MDNTDQVKAYQLRVYLRQISPMIWRRLQVRSDSTIADLHYTLQIAMGWDDFHLHQFIIRGKRYGESRVGGIFLSDGGDTVRNLQMYISPQAEHLLDWFHITMRITAMKQMAKGLPEEKWLPDVQAELESIK